MARRMGYGASIDRHGDANVPCSRWRRFTVYEHRVDLTCDDGGYAFATFNSEEEAEWAATLFNAAIGVRLTPLLALP